jgi:hypothetical protein
MFLNCLHKMFLRATNEYIVHPLSAEDMSLKADYAPHPFDECRSFLLGGIGQSRKLFTQMTRVIKLYALLSTEDRP